MSREPLYKYVVPRHARVTEKLLVKEAGVKPITETVTTTTSASDEVSVNKLQPLNLIGGHPPTLLESILIMYPFYLLTQRSFPNVQTISSVLHFTTSTTPQLIPSRILAAQNLPLSHSLLSPSIHQYDTQTEDLYLHSTVGKNVLDL